MIANLGESQIQSESLSECMIASQIQSENLGESQIQSESLSES